jgi:hypothetical protein
LSPACSVGFGVPKEFGLSEEERQSSSAAPLPFSLRVTASRNNNVLGSDGFALSLILTKVLLASGAKDCGIVGTVAGSTHLPAVPSIGGRWLGA